MRAALSGADAGDGALSNTEGASDFRLRACRGSYGGYFFARNGRLMMPLSEEQSLFSAGVTYVVTSTAQP